MSIVLNITNPDVESDEVIHEASGSHLLVTLRGCSPDMLNDEDRLRQVTHAAAEATGATVLQVCSHRFSPQGITVVVVLAESHASLHTYPESGVVFWDCFTCGSTCNPELSVTVLEEAFEPAEIGKQIVFRQ